MSKFSIHSVMKSLLFELYLLSSQVPPPLFLFLLMWQNIVFVTYSSKYDKTHRVSMPIVICFFKSKIEEHNPTIFIYQTSLITINVLYSRLLIGWHLSYFSFYNYQKEIQEYLKRNDRLQDQSLLKSITLIVKSTSTIYRIPRFHCHEVLLLFQLYNGKRSVNISKNNNLK